MNKNLLKKATSILVATSLISTLSSCKRKYIDSNNDINYSFENYTMYDYDTYIKNIIVIKYSDDKNNEICIPIYLENKSSNSNNKYCLYDLINGKLLYSANVDRDYAIINLGNELGEFINSYYASEYIIDEYGLKKTYTYNELKNVIDKIDNNTLIKKHY